MDLSGRHKTDIIIFLCFLLITSFGLLFRKMFIYSNEIRVLVDSLGNIGGVIVASFLFFYLANESKFRERELIILYVGFGLVIYEFLQILIPWQTFDLKDIWGTLFGVIIASVINILTFIFRNLHREYKYWLFPPSD
jgi:hypothetical protein